MVRDCEINPPGVGWELGMTRRQQERASSISGNQAVQGRSPHKLSNKMFAQAGIWISVPEQALTASVIEKRK